MFQKMAKVVYFQHHLVTVKALLDVGNLSIIVSIIILLSMVTNIASAENRFIKYFQSSNKFSNISITRRARW
jgi:hypothetical protein